MISFKVDKQSEAKLLATLADMDEKARNKLTRSSIRQSLGPLQRNLRRQWKAHPVKGDSVKKARKAVARALLIQVDRWRGPTSKITGSASRSFYGKIYISYKNKYGPARLAHLLENPDGRYPVTTSWRLHTKQFRKWAPKARQIFQSAARAFLAGYQMKDIRKAIKGQFG